jgi:hypothetical protein
MVREVFLPPLAAKDFFGASFCFFERLGRSPSRSKKQKLAPYQSFWRRSRRKTSRSIVIDFFQKIKKG